MVLLVQKLSFSLKHSSKLDNHQKTKSKPLLASLQDFRSDVSSLLIRLSANSKPGPEFISLKWVHQCFEILPFVNNAFAKLVVAIDYPMSKWEVGSIEEYLNYSITLLQLLNTIISSLSHLGHARVSLSHALSRVESSPFAALKRSLKEIRPAEVQDCKFDGFGKCNKERVVCSGKESIVHQALLVMNSIGSWVCGVVLSGLNSDATPYIEMKKSTNGFIDISPGLVALDSMVGKEILENRVIVKEVKEVNETVACVVSAVAHGEDEYSAAAKELERRLEALEEALKGVDEEANNLFSEVMAGRNELLDNLRRKKH